MKRFLLLLFCLPFLNVQAQTLLISEIADPNDDFSCRFVEIHCEGPGNCDFTGLTLAAYFNSNTTPQTVDLSPLGIIAPNDVVLIGKSVGEFNACYGFDPDLANGSVINSNGDDNFAILDAADNIIDVFGVPGEDGTGTCHEFEDGKAVRNANVTASNSTWDENEWTIFSDSNITGPCVSNTNDPQDVVDMTPGVSLLPVELTKFNVTTKNNKNILNWSTASEIDNDRFEIERSVNGSDFIKIGTVSGNGSTVRSMEYSFVDEAPFIGANYYRLKQVDYNGEYAFSNVKKVELRGSNTSVYPTVISDEVNIRVELSSTMELYNTSGVLINTFKLENKENSVNIGNIPPGSYIIRIVNAQENYTTQIVKR